MEFSKLRPFIADSKEDGADSVLYIKGFSGRAEIEAFEDSYYGSFPSGHKWGQILIERERP